MNKFETAREKGKQQTLNFYRKKWSHKTKQFNKEIELPGYFMPMIGDKKEVNIAELGAGIFCTIGNKLPGVKVNMYASDALADDFTKILDEKGVKRLIPVEKQDMAHLTYPDNFFDVVHCVNALDHVMDPLDCLHEMFRVCKPGGFIYLRHNQNVGVKERYVGLHQWNIQYFNSEWFRIWNPKTERLFPDFKSSLGKAWDYEPDDLIISIYHKPEDAK